jgi:hypothetical protein
MLHQFLLFYLLRPSRKQIRPVQNGLDDEPIISCINQYKNINNEVYCVCIKFPNLVLLTLDFGRVYMYTPNSRYS